MPLNALGLHRCAWLGAPMQSTTYTSGSSNAPAETAARLKNRLHREMRIFRCDFDGGYLFEIKPPVIQLRGLALDYTRATILLRIGRF
jgi:hypothetical protein